MSKEKTVTSQAPDLGSVLANLCTELAKANINVQDVLEQSGFGSRTDVALARLVERDDNALVLIADIKLVSKKGILADIASENTIPGALDPLMLGTAHGSLAKMIEAALVAPLLSAFQNFATKMAREHKEERNLTSFVDEDDQDGLDDFLTGR